MRKGKDVKNRVELAKWMAKHMEKDHSLTAIKGFVSDIYYDDEGKEPVKGKVNVAWVCDKTGERFDMIWE